jgi:hypothetical protein
MVKKNATVQNSDNMLADLFVCATSSSVEGNVRVHVLVCAPLSSFDASKTPRKLVRWKTFV